MVALRDPAAGSIRVHPKGSLKGSRRQTPSLLRVPLRFLLSGFGGVQSPKP